MNSDKAIDAAYEFFYGGDSMAGKAGVAIARGIRRGLVVTGALITGLILVLLGQVTQYSADIDEVRSAYLSTWAVGDSLRAAQMSEYERACQGPVSLSEDEPVYLLMSTYECAELAASKELADVLRSADAVVNAVPPLSWF